MAPHQELCTFTVSPPPVPHINTDITVTSQWGRMCLKSPASRLFYSTVYSGSDQRKHKSSISLAFVRGIHQRPVNSPHKGSVKRKMFPFDDIIMNVSIPTIPQGPILLHSNKVQQIQFISMELSYVLQIAIKWVFWHKKATINHSAEISKFIFLPSYFQIQWRCWTQRNFIEILIKIWKFSFKMMHSKIASAKWHPYHLLGGMHFVHALDQVDC